MFSMALAEKKPAKKQVFLETQAVGWNSDICIPKVRDTPYASSIDFRLKWPRWCLLLYSKGKAVNAWHDMARNDRPPMPNPPNRDISEQLGKTPCQRDVGSYLPHERRCSYQKMS